VSTSPSPCIPAKHQVTSNHRITHLALRAISFILPLHPVFALFPASLFAFAALHERLPLHLWSRISALPLSH
jgi:hypothetical protein